MKSVLARRRETKTDYHARLEMLRSGKLRLVVRKSNRYILAQIVDSKESQDKVLCSANSSELLNHGWNKELAGSLKSIPAGFLTGILLAGKVKKLNLKKDIVLDAGIYRSTKGSRIYSVVKGMIEGGVNIPAGKEILPSDERAEGKHLKKPLSIQELKIKLMKEK